MEDIDLMSSSCPNLRKVNLVIHYKLPMMDESHVQVRRHLLIKSSFSSLKRLVKIQKYDRYMEGKSHEKGSAGIRK